MTDNEIIKALECCGYWTGDKTCNDECPARGFGLSCAQNLARYAADLIHRLQEQNAALISGQETLWKYIVEKDAEIERLDKLASAYFKMCLAMTRKLEAAKSEAIKEFVEQLCNGRVSNDPVVVAVKAELKVVGTDE